MRKLLLIFVLAIISFSTLRADEGMWLPSLIKERIQDIRKKGFKLSAEDIYSINKASMKDAIVHFDGGCTGELISDKGLIITNHHCGFGSIQSHSSVEHDYLRDGFWAMKMEEELPNDDLWVKFLVRMEDVTGKVLKTYNPDMTEQERKEIIARNSALIIKEATKGTTYDATIESLYYGNQYFLFVYETFYDVRLVGAPPSSIGKFGGDTDNWMWPRQTGDFSIFRIYADKNNKPAKYSESNVPYKPKRHFSISTKGVKEGDFTMVYGFPGKTQEYLMSKAVSYISDISNPHKIRLRTLRLETQKSHMEKDQAVRIMYASKNASVANSWKKWQGEAGGIKRLGIVEKKRDYERRFNIWAANKPEYGGVISRLDSLYSILEPYSFANDYNNEAIKSNEIITFAGTVLSYLKKESGNIMIRNQETLKGIMEDFYKDYSPSIDKESFISLIGEYRKNIPENFQPDYFKAKISEFGSTEAFADYLFKNSILVSKSAGMSILDNKTDLSSLLRDPAVEMFDAFNEMYIKAIRPEYVRINNEITLLYRSYMKGQMEFSSDKTFYPDANSTLRIAYGKIRGYSPADAVYYKPSSTLEGIIQKDNPLIYDYNIPEKLREVYKNKDFGTWGSNGSVPVCFLADNHTSGGNSGSPVINRKGELIGINFDRVWEGTMSDVAFDPEMCRNISLDIRYVLFIIDRYANANWLIEEMDLK
ncbi:MAG: S46 family peptidase [Bacteroidales bacterium]|nr:S46 family peptidase [Bacteroidales bacterium]